MVKTKREIEQDLKLIDVVLILLDARIPKSSQNPEIEELTKNKKKIIILNKSDLSDEKENKKWINYFKEKNIKAICTELNAGIGTNEVIKAIEEIMKEEQKINIEKGRIGKPIRVSVLGIPNVGKSSFINRVLKRNSQEVGNKPGVTRRKQWIRVNPKIELLDTPGVLWPKLEEEKSGLNLAYVGTIKDEIIDKEELGYKLLEFLQKEYLDNLKERYKLDSIENLYEKIAIKRGAISKGGNIDYEKTSNIIIEDFRTGKLGKITLEKCEANI